MATSGDFTLAIDSHVRIADMASLCHVDGAGTRMVSKASTA